MHRVDDIQSGRFDSGGYRDVLTDYRFNGRKFNYRGKMPFSPLEAKNTYTTYFGPTYQVKDRCVYKQSVENYDAMILRIIGKRPLEEIKTVNNRKISPFRNHRGVSRKLHSYYAKVKSRLYKYTQVLGDNLSEQIRLACSPHVKQKLRLKAISELISKGEMLNTIFMKDIKGKIKIPEFAKAGKKPRLIGDFTCPGSLLAGFLVPCLKAAFGEPVVIDGSRFRFVYTTDVSELDMIFSEMDSSIFDEYVFFSDDMCAKVKIDGKYEWFNLDISSCDSSNGPDVFDRACWFFDDHFDHGKLLSDAVLQCKQRLVIHHPNKSVREIITARPSQPIEFSGTQLTTILNNIASAAICISISDRLRKGYIENFEKTVSAAALAVGYEVTKQSCRDLGDVQFLKHSFYRNNDGGISSFVNLGPLMRSAGTCWMDLPFNSKQGESIEDAARFRNWAVLQGFRNSGLSPFTEKLMSSPGYTRPVKYDGVIALRQLEKENEFKMYLSKAERQPVPLSVLLKRYNIQEDEWEQLLTLVHESDIGDQISCIAIDKIMHTDYGYSM